MSGLLKRRPLLLRLIRNVNIDIEEALKIACKYKIYAYDAYYLEAAYRLKLPLITFLKPKDKTEKNKMISPKGLP